jgi:hypothetical protein
MTESVVRDDMSEVGLRRVRVLSGNPIDVKAWIDKMIPAEARESTYLGWKDQMTGMHHLYLCWRAGMSAMRVFAMRGRSVAETAGQAACRYQQVHGAWPNTALVREGTVGMPEALEVREGETVKTVLRFKAVKWMMAGDVGVMIEKEEN